MVWYPLDWCYRMDIHLITPPASSSAISAAVSMDPSLSSLPLPRPDILAPDALSANTGTAEILRLPEVQAIITGDFLVLPCDLVCEVPGSALIESWMIREASFGGASDGKGERAGRRGGLGVWYNTKGEHSLKGVETDLIATTTAAAASPVTPPSGSLLPHISKLVLSMPTDTLHDIGQEKGTFPLRHSLLRAHANIKLRTGHRDAHVYLFPHWVLDFVARNERFDSISEDVVGWWVKAGWQDGLSEKLGLQDIFARRAPGHRSADEGALDGSGGLLEDEIDLGELSSTASMIEKSPTRTTARLASRVQRGSQQPSSEPLSSIPPMLSYIHPSGRLLQRVDSGALLLQTSLLLARHPPVGDVDATPLSHTQKIHPTANVAQRSTVTASDSLLAPHVSVAEKCVIKESVLAAGCAIETGARLTRCVLFDGVTVGERSVLSGCIIGKDVRIGRGSTLRDCEVQGGMTLSENSKSTVALLFLFHQTDRLASDDADCAVAAADAKNEKFMVFEGLQGDDLEDADGRHGDAGDTAGFDTV
ncbi:MAG: hypothetical protein M1825_004580 [Sarcosagium campestre]|nr:MAG: hypothetical protein M1825_004580 [Sarcosagium campestre]